MSGRAVFITLVLFGLAFGGGIYAIRYMPTDGGSLPTIRFSKQREDPKAVLEKAFRAQGGDERMARFHAYRMRTKGTFFPAATASQESLYWAKTEVYFSNEQFFRRPGQIKASSETEIEAKLFTQTLVLNGERGWFEEGGKTEELKAEDVAEARATLRDEDPVFGVYFMLKDPGYEVTAVPDEEVQGRAAVGLKVVTPEQKEYRFYFDKVTSLPLKRVGKTQERMSLVEKGKIAKNVTADNVEREDIYLNYKDGSQGVKYPGKVVVRHDGNKVMEWTVSDLRLYESLDDAVFAKP
jgi:hypothetical protein